MKFPYAPRNARIVVAPGASASGERAYVEDRSPAALRGHRHWLIWIGDAIHCLCQCLAAQRPGDCFDRLLADRRAMDDLCAARAPRRPARSLGRRISVCAAGLWTLVSNERRTMAADDAGSGGHRCERARSRAAAGGKPGFTDRG